MNLQRVTLAEGTKKILVAWEGSAHTIYILQQSLKQRSREAATANNFFVSFRFSGYFYSVNHRTLYGHIN